MTRVAQGRASMRRLARDTRGAGIIELAVVAPLLAFLMMIMIDGSRGFAAKAALESAAARTVEKVVAQGQSGSDYSTMRAEAATAAGVPITAVTLDTWLECDETRQASFNTVCPANQQIKRYLTIVINGTYTPMFDSATLAALYGGGVSMAGGVAIQGDAVVRLQ